MKAITWLSAILCASGRHKGSVASDIIMPLYYAFVEMTFGFSAAPAVLAGTSSVAQHPRCSAFLL
jgi:hypothetical protein